MHRMWHGRLVAGVLIGIIFGSRLSNAQYTANFQINIISGVTSNWTGDYVVGSTNFADVLLIQNSGVLSNLNGFLGSMSSSSNNGVLVSDTGSVWRSSQLFVGSGSSNRLTVSNGGQVFSSAGSIGGASNVVLTTDTGSVWHCQGNLTIGGGSGWENALIVSNGGQVVSGGFTQIGRESSSNSIWVVGPGSVWTNTGVLIFGGGGGSGGRAGNSMIIADGGQVVNASVTIGSNGGTTSNNSVLVTGTGSRWKNSGTITIGSTLSNNLTVAGGSVFALNLNVECNNLLELDSGSVIVTNANTNATLQVLGKLVLNGGTLQVDRIMMFNSCAQFIRTGGTLIYGTAVLDPNRDDNGDGIPNGWEQSYGLDPLNAADANVDTDGDGVSNLQEYLAGTDPTNSASAFRITSVFREGQDLRVTWMTGMGKTNALQAAAGSGDYNTNNFTTIFTVTNATGTTTNYLDIGAATNVPALYYRVRLVP